MNFDQIVVSSISDFQLLLESIAAPLAVGQINDQDFTILSRGYGRINWDYIITEKYNPYDSFDFCFKIKSVDVSYNVLLGAFISSYSAPDETLEIYGIENFSDSPLLKGKMFLYSLFASFIFMKKIDGQFIKLVDVEENNQALRNYYKQFGFKEDSKVNLTISVDSLEQYLKSVIGDYQDEKTI